MDKVFGEILGSGCDSDSIMLRLVRSSLDKAHENVQAKEGSIDLLNARSRFYELAMILVEGCSELVEEKAEIPETNREKMLSDLMESRNMVRGRLEELNAGIAEKDRELVERLETEWKLRQALELKERELVYLRPKLHLQRSKSERLEDEGGGDFCELKNSVDQQVWSIKQKLGDERISLTSNEHLELIPTSHLSRQEQNIVIEQMSSDIDGLKGTLDLAFGKMQTVEIRPLEKQWRWKIEKEIISILIKGFMSNLEYDFEMELGNRSKQGSFGFLNKHWMELINEITSLHRELETLWSSKDTEVKRIEEDKECPSIFLRRASSEPPTEFDCVKEPPQEAEEEKKDGGGGGGSNYVAKMVKNHESIIRKHRQELNQLKREILRENECFSVRRLKGPNNLATRIQEVTARLNNIIRWNAKIGDLNSVCQERKYRRMSSFTDSKEKVAHHDEIRKMKQERDDSDLQVMLLQEAYVTLFKGLAKDFRSELYDWEAQSLIRDDVRAHFLREMVSEWNSNIQTQNSEIEEENRISEDMLVVIFKEMIEKYRKDLEEIQKIRVDQEVVARETFLENELKEEIQLMYLRHMMKQWDMELEANDFETLIREDMFKFLLVESTRENCKKDSLSRKNLGTGVGLDLARKLDSLFKCLEAEEDLIHKASSEIKEHKTDNGIVASECEEMDERDAIEWLLTEEDSTFSSVSHKLDKALQLLSMTKALLKELQESVNTSITTVHESDKLGSQPKEKHIKPSDGLFFLSVGFEQLLGVFQGVANQKLEQHFLRLEDMSRKMHQLCQNADSLRKRELLYKQAFTIRCHNLKLAEAEVDLLGDQVDVLQDLLWQIYLILEQHLPVLSRYFQVSDVLELIKKQIL